MPMQRNKKGYYTTGFPGFAPRPSDSQFGDDDDFLSDYGVKPPKPPKRKPPPPPPKWKAPPKIAVKKVTKPITIRPDKLATSTTLLRVSNGRTSGTNTRGVAYPTYGNPVSVLAPPPVWSMQTSPQVSVVSTNVGSSSKLDSILGIASQIIAGFSRNPTVQTADGQTPIYDPSRFPQQQQVIEYPVNQAGNGGDPDPRDNDGSGEKLGAGLDGFIKWMAKNPMLVGGIGFGAYLLFRQPPKYGNR